jgi:hypothetical protein
VGWGLGFLEGLLGRKPARASGSGAIRGQANASALLGARGSTTLNPSGDTYEVSRKRDVATSIPPT